MDTQPVQPVVAPVQRAFNVHLWWIRLSILLVAATLAAFATFVTYRYLAAPAAPAIRSDRAPAITDTSPFKGTTGSAYDGQEYRSAPLAPAAIPGIDAPTGANINELPTGLTDYLRPGSVDQARSAPAVPLGIDLPTGVDINELPSGLTDYLRPQNPDEAIQAQPQVPGIQMPTGVDDPKELPEGLREYVNK